MTETRVIASTSQQDFSSPPLDLQSSLARRAQKRPPPLRPRRPDEQHIPRELLSPQYLHEQYVGEMPSLRQIRSAETFSTRPHLSPGLPSPGFGGPPGPAPALPPRRSSRLPPSIPEEQKETLTRETTNSSTESTLSGDWDRILPLYEHQRLAAEGNIPPVPPISKAMKLGAINTAKKADVPPPMGSPMFSPPLEKVIEEPEGIVSPRLSVEMARQQSIRHTKSSPSISVALPPVDIPPVPRIPLTAALNTRTSRPMSQGSDTLGDLSRRSFVIEERDEGKDSIEERFSRDTQESSGTLTSWEDDIDFCYKLAAEADCDFDWSNISRLDIDSSGEEETPLPPSSPVKIGKHQFSSSFDSTSGSESGLGLTRRRSKKSLIPSKESLPELEHNLSHSDSTSSLAIGTPAEKFGFAQDILRRASIQRSSGDSWNLASPRLPPLDLTHDLDSDRLYEDLMAGFNMKKLQHSPSVPLLEAKVYAGPTPPLPQKAFQPLPKPAPTSVPSTISASLSKELPPLPSTAGADIPGPLRLNTIVAGLRSPNDSPIEHVPTSFSTNRLHRVVTAPEASPPRVPLKRFPSRAGSSPPSRIQELSTSLSRNASDDTIITTIPAPPSPPASPKRAAPAPPGIVAPTPTPTSATPGLATPMLAQRSASSSGVYSAHAAAPAVLALQGATHKKAASSDGLPVQSSPPGTPAEKGKAGQRESYSLFPTARGGRPRRLTTTT